MKAAIGFARLNLQKRIAANGAKGSKYTKSASAGN
jgi:hypothetical protein